MISCGFGILRGRNYTGVWFLCRPNRARSAHTSARAKFAPSHSTHVIAIIHHLLSFFSAPHLVRFESIALIRGSERSLSCDRQNTYFASSFRVMRGGNYIQLLFQYTFSMCTLIFCRCAAFLRVANITFPRFSAIWRLPEVQSNAMCDRWLHCLNYSKWYVRVQRPLTRVSFTFLLSSAFNWLAAQQTRPSRE